MGRNKDNPLNDDDYLKAHWIMYFKYSGKLAMTIFTFYWTTNFHQKVLEQVALAITVQDTAEIRDIETDDDAEDIETEETKPTTRSKLTISSIEICRSIQQSAICWFNSFNPYLSDCTQEEKKWLDRLNRIGIGYFRPLVMSSFAAKGVASTKRVELFKAIERFIFIAFRISRLGVIIVTVSSII